VRACIIAGVDVQAGEKSRTLKPIPADMHPEGGFPTKIYEERGELYRAGRNNGQPFW